MYDMQGPYGTLIMGESGGQSRASVRCQSPSPSRHGSVGMDLIIVDNLDRFDSAARGERKRMAERATPSQFNVTNNDSEERSLIASPC
jgi:hypothetical protein